MYIKNEKMVVVVYALKKKAVEKPRHFACVLAEFSVRMDF